jgi:2-amino-4-hydroxy-6-hydroxymethyldihydropteridine diphosphokinase
MPRVFVSIGTNQDREASLQRALDALRSRFGEVSVSPVYECVAVGFQGDPFLNLAAGFDTDEPLQGVSTALREIEARCGRVRSGRPFEPRPMDIDLLIYGDLVSESGGMDLPRGEMLQQAYVLRPLAELAPDALHPQRGETFAALRARLALDESGMAPWPGSHGEGEVHEA